LISDIAQPQILSSPVTTTIEVKDDATLAGAVINEAQTDIVGVFSTPIPPTSPPSSNQTTASNPILEQLRVYAWSKINQDREKFGLSDVKVSTNQAAQAHAVDVLKTGVISHWMTDGEKFRYGDG